MFSEVAEIALVATRLGQFQQLLKTRVILILNFTRPHAITYTYTNDVLNRQQNRPRHPIITVPNKRNSLSSTLFRGTK